MTPGIVAAIPCVNIASLVHTLAGPAQNAGFSFQFDLDLHRRPIPHVLNGMPVGIVNAYCDNGVRGGAVKLAGFLPVLLAIPGFAQSSGPHGTRIGQVQTEYLKGPATDQAGFQSDRSVLQSLTQEELLKRQRAIPTSPLTPSNTAPTPRDPGPRIEFETWVEQLSRDYAESVVTGETGVERAAGKATIHRFVRDNFRKTNLTYTVTLETIPGTETLRVAFSDSSIPYPVPQILRDGETIALTLSADARTGWRMVDYIRVGTGLLRPRQDAARDVYAEDAELTIAQPRLRTNGVEQQSATPPSSVSAPVVWVDIPGQGRYLLSFKPRSDQGFVKAGEVAENSLVFSSGGNIFRIDCADRIATGSGTYNIYARRDAGDPTLFGVGVAESGQR
jgi:hypothetical protein